MNARRHRSIEERPHYAGWSRGSGRIEIFWDTIALTIGALLPIMNPFSTAPLFVSLTSNASPKLRNKVALQACLYAFAILAVFLLLGAAIIDFFGISVPGLRVAGGVIISTIGFRMLFPKPAVAPAGRERVSQSQELEVAFTPLAMPSLAGPGSISVVLTAAAQIRTLRPNDFALIYLAVIIGMVITLVIAFAVLRAASSMVRFLGKAGIDAMTRIFGFLLIAIAMQFLLTGISDFYGLKH
jgi:multiple antibiotic resistance protein